MRQKSVRTKEPAERIIKRIRRCKHGGTSRRRTISALCWRGCAVRRSIAELCRREGICSEPLLSLVEGFLNAGKREATGRQRR
jgi:hypothetical protein